MRGEVLISVNIPISPFPLSLTHSALADIKFTISKMKRFQIITDYNVCNLTPGVGGFCRAHFERWTYSVSVITFLH